MKNVKVILMTIVAVLFVGTASAQTFDDAVAKYTAAMEKVKAKDYKAAITLLDEAMNIGIDLEDEGAPELVREVQSLLPKLYLQMGGAAAAAKNYDESVSAFLKAEELADLYGNTQIRALASRTLSNVYLAIGVDSFNGKEYAKALEAFNKGYEQDPSNIKLAGYTAKSYAELGQFGKAVDIYKTIIETGTANNKYAEDAKSATEDVTQYGLINIVASAEAKDLDKAIAYADTLAIALPKEPQAAITVVQLANNLKKYDVVIERGEAAAEAQTDPAKKSDVYFLIGAAYQNKENKPKAIEAYGKVTAGANVATARTAIADLSK